MITLGTLTALRTLVALMLPGLEVSSDTICPSTAAVEAALGELAPAGTRLSGSVHVVSEQQILILELARPGERPRRRRLPGEGSCEQRARGVAVAVASWLGDIAWATLSASPPEPPPDTSTARAGERTAPAPAPSRTFLVGLGLLGALDRQGGNGGLRVEAGLRRTGLDLRLDLSVLSARDRAVGQGAARWTRPSTAITAALPWRTSHLSVLAGGGPALGIVIVQGRGYDVDQRDWAFSFGLHAGVRVVRQLAAGEVWVDLRTEVWPLSQSLRNVVRSSRAEVAVGLPTWTALVAFGASVALFGP